MAAESAGVECIQLGAFYFLAVYLRSRPTPSRPRLSASDLVADRFGIWSERLCDIRLPISNLLLSLRAGMGAGVCVATYDRSGRPDSLWGDAGFVRVESPSTERARGNNRGSQMTSRHFASLCAPSTEAGFPNGRLRD